jgi:hypothetical protein
VPLGSSPSAVAAGDGALWVSNYNAGTVSRIDAATHALVETIPVGSGTSGIAAGAGAVWVANTLGGTVSRIDPGVDRVLQPIAVGNGPSEVAFGDGSVWVANSLDGTLMKQASLESLLESRGAQRGERLVERQPAIRLHRAILLAQLFPLRSYASALVGGHLVDATGEGGRVRVLGVTDRLDQSVGVEHAVHI